MWPTGEGKGSPLQHPRKPHGQYQKLNDMIPEDEPLRVGGARGEGRRAITSGSRRSEAARPKPKGRSAVDMSGRERKVRCRKEIYIKKYIRTWNVRSTNQGKLDVVKR